MRCVGYTNNMFCSNCQGKNSPTDAQPKNSPLLTDNYDQVEMDIDSDDGSSATIVVAPDHDQILIPGLDIVNRLQAVSLAISLIFLIHFCWN